jgi:hypothetical protein
MGGRVFHARGIMTFKHCFKLVFVGHMFCSLVFAQEAVKTGQESAASPEMARVAKALAGNWSNIETFEHSEEFPNCGERRGTSHCELSTGGTTLTCAGKSDGSAGTLDHLVIIWWDTKARAYRFFTCFKDRVSNCEVRGTAHWEGDTFVNDYTEKVKGNPTPMRDSFIDITVNSHTLVFAVKTPDGKMKTLITTRSTRR